jgi:hypothetical protein
MTAIKSTVRNGRINVATPADWPEGCEVVIEPMPGHAAPSPEDFITRAQRLAQLGKTNAALDLLYDSIDGFMRRGEFPALDSFIARAPVATLSSDILLGLLTATLPARSRLSSRKTLLSNVEATLRSRGEYEEGLLAGLE